MTFLAIMGGIYLIVVGIALYTNLKDWPKDEDES